MRANGDLKKKKSTADKNKQPYTNAACLSLVDQAGREATFCLAGGKYFAILPPPMVATSATRKSSCFLYVRWKTGRNLVSTAAA